MTETRSSRTRVSLGAALSIALGAFVLATPVSGAALSAADDTASNTANKADAARSGGLLGHEADAGLDVRDRVLPTSAQESAADALDAVDIRWNAHGTPTSLITSDGVLAPADSSNPVTAARGFLRDKAAVFGLSPAQIDDLELVSDQLLADGGGHAVLFRQTYDGLAAATEGLVTVGVADGDITYVSSSLSKVSGTPAKPTLSPKQAWLKAAASAGLSVADDEVGKIVTDAASKLTSWTKLAVPGLATDQLVRLRALPVPGEGVRPVFQSTVVDSAAATLLGETVLVDAVTGKVLLRQSNVNHENDLEGPFTGTALGACGPRHSFEVTDDKTRTLAAVAVGLPVDDFTVKLFDPSGELLVEGDLLTSPEAATYSAEKIEAGTYSVQVCPFDDSLVAGSYAVTVASSDTAAETGDLPGSNPRWSYFPGTPDADSTGGDAVPANDVVACWTKESECTGPELKSLANAGPWDTLLNTAVGVPSLTTIGNNANTHEGWLSPLAAGGLEQAPISPVRDYSGKFTDAWNNSQCSPANLVPGGNDVNYVVGNLFTSHNRMHDWSYFLGFTEENYNLQTDNLGRGGRGLDAEIGNAQAAAIDSQVIEQTGLLTGRNNANQLTLMDGVPGITNQYLFQPAAGAFYAPCTDGSLDFGIVGHEYTHAISNRMIGGPDDGITSEQGGAMGESWGDLAAAEHMFAHDIYNGGSPWAVGAYATGNTEVAIRDFAIDKNPLNFSDYGFDTTGPEVHADGEIWNGTMWSVRKALVDKYDAAFPYADKALQLRCSDGTTTASPLAADKCPGNRRWIQLVFDSFLLQQGATSMLDARDAFLAADQMRFGGANRQVIADAFAQRGMGQYATTTADDHEPVPSFASPESRSTKVTFNAPGSGKVYVGRFEARATPIADTSAATALGSVAHFVPGTYEFVYVSKTGGAQRKTVTISPAETTKTISFAATSNLAAASNGAEVIGSTEGSRNPGALIDGTEGTNWGGVTEGNVDETTPSIAVDLAGGSRTVKTVGVSAYLSPATDTDADSGSRFTALRKFALEACVSACDTAGATWKRFYTSPDDAFPGKRPRPVAPNLNLRTFDVPDTTAAAVRLVALENQCTGYDGYAGEQDADPTTTTDCKTGSDRGTIVHAAELQVFGQ
ncbi:fungalysin metallopeptidase (M36) [Nocardioides albertanoniae]|uniref:Fungalysin metallopeptidase (M36) n=1 Tax=Nocardioides albertanoniae TaxID=1175486 RepID=A0A543A4K7_9ACTN|nr:M36 family metallopeptidase [Nocardioides albertanoniae]TQL67535.1 fungalysin metallopeptidase (M36) [Nocardioides albertanoniae]